MDENQIGTQIIDSALSVHRALGPGLLEGAYETCLAYELSERGLFVETQKALPLTYKGLVIERGYRLDMLVNELVVVELKSVETITDVHRAQVLSYLKLGPYRLGFLINFNTSRIKNGIQRFVNGLDDR
jgi:GxxExxY protein